MKAYLDIETNFKGQITVIGILRPKRGFVQFIEENITAENVALFLHGTREIFSYNGNNFDLKIIKRQLGLDIRSMMLSNDLMYRCWKQGLKGGLKAVEKTLGIVRQTDGLTGRDAPKLWEEYRKYRCMDSLNTLLRYNKDDVYGLEILEKELQMLESGKKDIYDFKPAFDFEM